MLHIYPSLGISSLRDWMRLLAADKSVVRDEYENYVGFADMIQIICARRNDDPVTDGLARLQGFMDLKEFLARNYAELDESTGLLRARVDGTHCIKRGTGSYDYFMGDFS
jgi:hypothetical protein